MSITIVYPICCWISLIAFIFDLSRMTHFIPSKAHATAHAPAPPQASITCSDVSVWYFCSNCLYSSDGFCLLCVVPLSFSFTSGTHDASNSICWQLSVVTRNGRMHELSSITWVKKSIKHLQETVTTVATILHNEETN